MIATTMRYKSTEVLLHCLHAGDFPSPLLFQGMTQNASEIDMNLLRREVHARHSQGEFKTVGQQNLYEKFKVWERECGILSMGDRCFECKHARLSEPNPKNPAQQMLIPWIKVKAKIH